MKWATINESSIDDKYMQRVFLKWITAHLLLWLWKNDKAKHKASYNKNKY